MWLLYMHLPRLWLANVIFLHEKIYVPLSGLNGHLKLATL